MAKAFKLIGIVGIHIDGAKLENAKDVLLGGRLQSGQYLHRRSNYVSGQGWALLDVNHLRLIYAGTKDPCRHNNEYEQNRVMQLNIFVSSRANF